MTLNARNRRQPTAAPAPPSWRAATLALLAACLLLLVLGLPSRDAAGQAPDEAAGALADRLWWRTIDGGGASFVYEGDYALGGTAGQPDAGDPVTEGPYTLHGGFWAAWPGIYHVYLPALMRSVP